MAIMLLGKRVLDAAETTGSRYEIFDTKLKGFGLRVGKNGEKTWFVIYRVGDGGRNAQKRRVSIGKSGTLTPEEARDAAQKLLASVKLGSDPATAKITRRSTITVEELAKKFLSAHVNVKRKSTTAAWYADIINRIIMPRLGSLKIDAVKRADVAILHVDWAHTPFQANRLLATIGSMYNFGMRVGLVPDGLNPARGIERFSEQGRERFLTTVELERIGSAIREAETIGVPWNTSTEKPESKHLPKDLAFRRSIISKEASAALRLLIFTGARLREILHLRWTEVDMERGMLFLPDSKTGRKTIVVNAPALAILSALPRTSIYVIPGETRVIANGEVEYRPRADLKRPWAVVSKRAGLEGVRLHDLRHTFASYGATGGLGLPMIGKLLGHMNQATTARYAHLGNDPLRRASDTIAWTISSAMGEQASPGEVVSLPKRG